MATGSVRQSATGDQDIDGLLTGVKWNASRITYNFPSSASSYPSNYGGANDEPTGFHPVSSSFKTMFRAALHQYELVANVDFVEVGASAPANISAARTSSLGNFSGYGYAPGTTPHSGDVWYSSDFSRVGDSQVLGRGTWRLVMHEIGHALGLKHGQEAGGVANTPMTVQHDYNDYSIMSYLLTRGGSASAPPDRYSLPQSLMMYDIAAVQEMYGANYRTQGGNTVYSWDPRTGQESINGAKQTVSDENKIFMTLWDGGGNDTYDLSRYTTALKIDLRPGEASTFSNAQLAITDAAHGTKAGGNVFNALLHHDDTRSLIENAHGGAAGDTIVGNQGGNTLNGGLGKDVLTGGTGKDTFVFDTRPSAANLDHIKDFKAVDDTIRLENTGTGLFTKLHPGHLHTDEFALITSSAQSVDPHAHILYDKAHGALYYDPNGGSAAGRVEFAVLDNHAALTFQDFLVV